MEVSLIYYCARCQEYHSQKLGGIDPYGEVYRQINDKINSTYYECSKCGASKRFLTKKDVVLPKDVNEYLHQLNYELLLTS